MVTSHVHNIYANQARYDNDMHEGQGRKCREISTIYHISEASDTIFRKKSPIYSKNRLGSHFIADF